MDNERISEWERKVKENKEYWYADPNEYVLKKCVLSKNYEMIRFIEEDGSLCRFSQGYKPINLHGTLQDATNRLNDIKSIYIETFKHKPFVNEEFLTSHLNELVFIEKSITYDLKEYDNFEGIDFCDVNAGGVQIRGHHKLIKGYTYGSQSTIEYDFSNYKDCINEFVMMWKENDTPELVKRNQAFIADGEKWGWD